MKKIIIVAAVVLTTGVVTVVTHENGKKADKTIKITMDLDKNVIATCD